MKYSFRLYSTGPKTKIKVHWGVPLNLQACSKCKALNHTMATRCTKCSHPLSEPNISANNPVASTATATKHENHSQSKAATIQEQIPDASSPPIAITSNASPSQTAPTPDRPTPDMLMLNRRLVMSNEQKRLRRTWGVALFAYVAIASLIVVFSLQPPSAPPPATKNFDSNTGGRVVIPPPLEPVIVASEQKTLPVVPDQELAATDPVIVPAATSTIPEPASLIPTLSKQSKPAALPRTTKFADKQTTRTTKKPTRTYAEKAVPVASGTPKAPLSRPREPVAPAKTPCSEAALALALCNAN